MKVLHNYPASFLLSGPATIYMGKIFDFTRQIDGSRMESGGGALWDPVVTWRAVNACRNLLLAALVAVIWTQG
jgi:hypothetical protein